MMILMMLMELGKYNKIQSVSTAKVTATWWWLSNWKFFLNIFFIARLIFFSYVIFKFNKFQKLHFILQTCTRPFRILHHGSNLSRVFCSEWQIWKYYAQFSTEHVRGMSHHTPRYHILRISARRYRAIVGSFSWSQEVEGASNLQHTLQTMLIYVDFEKEMVVL